jgi:hypothetical protein
LPGWLGAGVRGCPVARFRFQGFRVRVMGIGFIVQGYGL